MEGQRFCGVEDEDRAEVIFSGFQILSNSDVLLQFVPIVPFQIQKLSDSMYNECLPWAPKAGPTRDSEFLNHGFTVFFW